MSYKWETLDTNQSPPPSDVSKQFTLSATPGTDIWRSGPDHDVFTGSALYTRLRGQTFKSASVSVSADWKTQYDQGGLLLAFSSSPGGKAADVKQWIKAGVEVLDSEARIGVVGTYAFSDWSLAPLSEEEGKHGKVQLKIVRSKKALWVYAVRDGKDVPVREVTWAFQEGRDDGELWVGVYTVKPKEDADDAKRELQVRFEGLEIETES